MREIVSLVEAYLTAECDLVAAVDTAGGTVPLPGGRTVTVGRAEFDALPGRQRKRAWVIIRAYPFVALAFALTPLLEAMLFGETMSLRLIVGILFILCGLFLVIS
jgi:hypothetical protein